MRPAQGHPSALLILATLVAGMVGTPRAGAAEPFTQDGWYTWRVDAVEHAGDWCCYRWNAGRATRTECRLEERNGSWGQVNHGGAPDQPRVDELQLYARFENGALNRLRTLSPSCEVSSDTSWTDLGKVDNVRSVEWLMDQDSLGHPLREDRLMAIAAHAGEASRRELVRVARDPAAGKTRENAIFWMGQLRVEETRDELLALMDEDASRRIREHAIFAYSQSDADDRLEVLIDVIEDRHKDLHDRKQALFWLAQSDDGAGVDYIQRLLLD